MFEFLSFIHFILIQIEKSILFLFYIDDTQDEITHTKDDHAKIVKVFHDMTPFSYVPRSFICGGHMHWYYKT